MAISIINCEQNSEEWQRARMGIPTASEFKTIVGIKKDAREKVTRQAYIRKLAGEILTGEPMENYTNAHMERGHAQEDEARNLYAFQSDAEPQRVGFIKSISERVGCSPDSLIGDKGGLEIKTALPHIQIERLEKGELPPEHRHQVHGAMWLCKRDWWDFVSYCPKLPLLIVRVQRDDGLIAQIAGAVKEFNAELDELVERIRRYGTAESKAA